MEKDFLSADDMKTQLQANIFHMPMYLRRKRKRRRNLRSAISPFSGQDGVLLSWEWVCGGPLQMVQAEDAARLERRTCFPPCKSAEQDIWMVGAAETTR